MKGALGIVIGTLCAILVACMSAQKTSSAPPVVPESRGALPSAAQRPDTPDADEIDRLTRLIDEQREQMHIQVQHGTQVEPLVVMECRPATTETCKQSCTLSTTICDNSKQICDIAKKLGNDAWANQKCADGNATCNAAHKDCCDCTK